MSARRITIERVLRDADDASGQSIREWKIEAEAGHVTIWPAHGDILLLRAADIELFIEDLQAAEINARVSPPQPKE